MAFGRERGLSDAMLDRLLLVDDRIEAMAKGLDNIAVLPDPLGRTIDERERPNGLKIARVSVPLGVIGIIYAIATKRDRRCGCALFEIGQRGYSARWVGKSPFIRGDCAMSQGWFQRPAFRKARYSRSRPGIAPRSGLCFGCRILSISSYRGRAQPH